MNRLLALGFVLLLATQAMAQQKPQYTQYTLNNYLLNPAIAGIEDYTDVKIGMRQQWSGLEGAPRSFYATIHAPLMKEVAPITAAQRNSKPAKESSTKKPASFRRIRPHHGLGAMAMTTATGPLKRSSFNASYSYHQPLTRTLRVAAGVSPGLIQYSLDPTAVRVINPNDKALNDGRINEMKFDLNMGLWLYSYNYYVGVAGAQLVPSKREYLTTGMATDNNGRLQQHYFLTAGYRLDVTPDLALIPSAMIKMAQPSPVSVDATLKALYSDRVWAAASYRHKESVAIMAGVNISYLMDLSYSYDALVSPLGTTNTGSHEIVLGFKLRNTSKIICPQWAW